MHDIKKLTENLGDYKVNLKNQGFDSSLLDEVVALNEKRKVFTAEVEKLRGEVKTISKEVGMLKKEGKDATELQSKVGLIKAEIDGLEKKLDDIEAEQNHLAATIPNTTAEDVPAGDSEEENHEVHKWGEPTNFSFEPKDHVTLGENLNALNFEVGAKLTGARFVLYRGAFARLERALINFMIDQHLDHGYEEMIPPFIVNEKALYGTGNLPKFEDDLFKLKIEDRNWYLIPTAEVPLTNIKAGELFDEGELPIKACAYTPCFRSEAGSYGKDTKGLIRLHQFNKVEMVNIVEEDKSWQALEDMKERAMKLLEQLGLPYRIVTLCSGDIGFSAKKTYDFEVWVPSQNKYREISSVSNCWDFQARRAKIRYRSKNDKKPKFAHTLNGSGLAVGRTLLAIVENYQNEDGSIRVPEILVPYMGGMTVIKK